MKESWAAGGLTPVQAVPANTQARGSRYQGEYAMKAMLAKTEQVVNKTADQALRSFTSNTCKSNSGF